MKAGGSKSWKQSLWSAVNYWNQTFRHPVSVQWWFAGQKMWILLIYLEGLIVSAFTLLLWSLILLFYSFLYSFNCLVIFSVHFIPWCKTKWLVEASFTLPGSNVDRKIRNLFITFQFDFMFLALKQESLKIFNQINEIWLLILSNIIYV